MPGGGDMHDRVMHLRNVARGREGRWHDPFIQLLKGPDCPGLDSTLIFHRRFLTVGCIGDDRALMVTQAI